MLFAADQIDHDRGRENEKLVLWIVDFDAVAVMKGEELLADRRDLLPRAAKGVLRFQEVAFDEHGILSVNLDVVDAVQEAENPLRNHRDLRSAALEPMRGLPRQHFFLDRSGRRAVRVQDFELVADGEGFAVDDVSNLSVLVGDLVIVAPSPKLLLQLEKHIVPPPNEDYKLGTTIVAIWLRKPWIARTTSPPGVSKTRHGRVSAPGRSSSRSESPGFNT